MRRKLVLCFILCQLLVLGFMAGKREYIRAYGQQIYLRTAPIDPRDPFRGDFVRLHYGLSRVNARDWRGTVKEHQDERGHQVYAVLRAGADDLYALDYLTDEQPAERVYLKGRTSSRGGSGPGAGVSVKYGIEQYFVEQGRGRTIEQRRGSRNKIQVPMEVRLAVGGDGTAVIRDYRWSRLGIKLEMLRVTRRNRNRQPATPGQPLSPKVKVTLKNVSSEPLMIADPGPHCGFTMVAVNWSRQEYGPADHACETVVWRDADLRALQPEQEYAVELELSEPRWHVIWSGSTMEIGALPSPEMFRIVYQAPAQAQTASPQSSGRLWLGELPSRAFNAVGRID